MSEKLLLNPGAFWRLLREYSAVDYNNIQDEVLEPYVDCNPMGLRIKEIVSAYEEETGAYGVNDLYVLDDYNGTLYGLKLYRGLGKHDEYNELYEIESNLVRSDPEDVDEYPLELVPLIRKATYNYYVLG